MTIETSHGSIKLPAFFPVTTFGDKYPLDKLVQPYLKRTNPCLMVSHYYAQKMKKRPNMPIFIDSGGFAGLFEGSVFKDYGDHASIVTKDGDEIHPLEVLRFQEKNADLGATLDFIIPPKTDPKEAQHRLDLTLKNAQYAINQLATHNPQPTTLNPQPFSSTPLFSAGTPIQLVTRQKNMSAWDSRASPSAAWSRVSAMRNT